MYVVNDTAFLGGNHPKNSSGSVFRKFLVKSPLVADYFFFVFILNQYDLTASFNKTNWQG